LQAHNFTIFLKIIPVFLLNGHYQILFYTLFAIHKNFVFFKMKKASLIITFLYFFYELADISVLAVSGFYYIIAKKLIFNHELVVYG
jgi:hypothetical protein